jgi:hypothetical protein
MIKTLFLILLIAGAAVAADSTEYTNETTVISYGKATIPSFISADGSASIDLGNFVGFVLILLGIFAVFYYSRIFNDWH